MIFTKFFKNHILLSGPNRTSEHSSYLFSLDGGFFECHWKTTCPRDIKAIASFISINEGCTGVETVIFRHSYISQVVYEQNLYFGLGPKPNHELADAFSPNNLYLINASSLLQLQLAY